MNPLDDLRRMTPPPSEPPPPADVATAEAQLGFRLPDDYLTLVEQWGAGTFDDFISILAPGHDNPNLDLVHEARGWEWALGEQARAGERHPFEPRIAVGGLLAWGRLPTAIHASGTCAERIPPHGSSSCRRLAARTGTSSRAGSSTSWRPCWTAASTFPSSPTTYPSATPRFQRL